MEFLLFYTGGGRGDIEKKQVKFNSITALLLVASLFLSFLAVSGILPLEDNSNTIAYESISRINNTIEQEYRIVINEIGTASL